MSDSWFFRFVVFFSDGFAALCRLPLSGFMALAILLGLPAFMAFTEWRKALKAAATKQSELSNERFAEVIRPLYERLDQTADVTSEFEAAVLAARRVVALYGNIPQEQKATSVGHLTFFLLEHFRAAKA